MLKLAALVAALAAAYHADLGADAGPLERFALPAVVLAGLLFALGPVGTAILGLAGGAFALTDMMSDSPWTSVVAPLFFVACLVAFLVWAWAVGHLRGGGAIDGVGVGSDVGDAGGGGC